jgi:hypothetical protein
LIVNPTTCAKFVGIIGRFIGYQFANVDYLSFLPAYIAVPSISSSICATQTSCHFVFL